MNKYFNYYIILGCIQALFFSSAFSREGDIWGTANPICSEQGLKIFFLNGVLNSRESAVASTSLIKEAIVSNGPHFESHEKILDENSVSYDTLWNKTWSILDFAVFALQKIRESSIIDNDIYSKLKKIKSNDDMLGEYDHTYERDVVEDAEAEHIIASFKKELSTGLVDEFAKRIIEAIDTDNKKVIVVAHSQGNMYLNETILRIIGVRPDLQEKIDRYFASIYIASPAYSYMPDLNATWIKLNQDSVTGWMGVHGNYELSSSALSGGTYHKFREIYLNDSIMVEGNYSMRDLFLKALYDKARSFYANCCRDSYGGRISRGGLHPNGMGWVSNPNKVPSLFKVDKAAEICGDVNITGAGEISELVHIRGNGEINNFQAGPIDFKHPDKYLGFAKGVEVPRFETPMILIENSDIENAGIWVEDIESINPTVSPMGIIRSSKVKNPSTLRNAIIDNESTVDGPVSITESKVDSSTVKSSQAPNGQDYYINKSTVEDGAEISDSMITNGSVISQAKISNNSFIANGNLSGDTVIDDSTVLDAFLTNVHLLNSAYSGGDAKKLNITNSMILDGDITEGELRCSFVMNSILSKSTIINSIIDGENFLSETKTNNICPNLNTYPGPDTCEEPQELDECVGNPKTKSKSFWSNFQKKNFKRLLILNKGKNIQNLF